MTALKKILPLHPVVLVAGFDGAALLAWLVKDRLAPYLLGTTFAERGLAVKAAFLLALTLAFFIYITLLLVANARVTESGRVKLGLFLGVSGAITGAFIFLFVFGPGTLDGTRVDWLMGLGDNAMHYLGWVFYRHDLWAFPLTFTPSLGYPYGISVSLTDPVTLFILPFKLLGPLLPEPFQYFGLWTLACFALQGAFAALLVYELSQSRAAALLAPLFFCLAPVLLYRVYTYIPHVGQWTILAALLLYFRGRRAERVSRWWPAVLVAGLLAQPYFLGILGLIFLAAMLERAFFRQDWQGALMHLGINAAASGLAMWVTGMAGGDYDMAGASVDYFKANLNSLVNPVNAGWSAFLPPLPLAPNTYPNLHYLGLGVILLFTFALVAWVAVNRKAPARILRDNAVLIGLMLALSVLSLGNVVTLNERVLFAYQLPAPLMRAWAVFRATERFLWPVGYLVIVFALVQTARLLRRDRWVALALTAALAVQYADLAPIVEEKFAAYHDPQGFTSPLKSRFWEDAAGQYRHVVMLPLNLRDWAWLTDYAAAHRMTTNYFYFGRSVKDITAGAKEKLGELSRGQVGADELYVLTGAEGLRSVCGLAAAGTPFAYVDGQFVLAPGFSGDLAAYPDIAVTGANFQCEPVGLADFLDRYADKLVVLSVKEDASRNLNEEDAAALRSLGLQADLRGPEGKSYAAAALNGKALFERLADGRVDFDLPAPVPVTVSSAGRISGEEISQIIVDGKDYSFNRPGLNVVVIDPETGEVVRAALFELSEQSTSN